MRRKLACLSTLIMLCRFLENLSQNPGTIDSASSYVPRLHTARDALGSTRSDASRSARRSSSQGRHEIIFPVLSLCFLLFYY
ncbi:hypothetical protein M438DRAFT_191143 [Aureobasidium pullulans EXF-150]|uniref:Secreted protein n=1 Tax=Aureobasidium pullulans EXF-150 TaxID=1043002 RepID=A0A074XR83_AURPU|nr:uncharacterized protein M438DRAFT_191143 [Aureobasidium pullulans EXF-150]KEQ86129.1 hypothetical protein M438DRAFT_191143 [Aureobasidium pullulans EXF-150]